MSSDSNTKKESACRQVSKQTTQGNETIRGAIVITTGAAAVVTAATAAATATTATATPATTITTRRG